MDYGRLLARAFHITWNNRYLWWLGILAGSAGGANFRGGGSFSDSGSGNLEELFPRLNLEQISPILIVLAVVLVLLFIVLMVISVMCRGGLIAAVIAIEQGAKWRFGTAFAAGYHAFWRLVAVGLLLFCAIVGVLAILASPAIVLYVTVGEIAGIIVGVVFILPFLAALVYVGVVYMFAIRFAVGKGTGGRESIYRANDLILRFKGPAAIVWILSLALNIGIQIGFLVVILLQFGIAFLVGFAVYTAAGLTGGIIAGAIVGLPALAAAILLGGVITTYFSSFWTLAYLDLMRQLEPPAEIEEGEPAPLPPGAAPA